MKNIIFMGTPDFAIPSLKELMKNQNYSILQVYTKPHKIVRNKKLNSPIYNLAIKNNLNVVTPTSLKNAPLPENLFAIVIVAYGLIIPEKIINLPKFCINIHPSLLPRWRGASPIESAILNGDKETGVAVMKVAKELDAGDIFQLKKIPIEDEDNYNSLSEKLALLGAQMLIDVLDNIENIKPQPQNSEGLTYAHKIQKSLIDWNNSAEYICNQIRAFGNMNCNIKNETIKILKAKFQSIEHNYTPGTIINNKIHIACKNGILIPLVIQKSGKTPTILQD